MKTTAAGSSVRATERAVRGFTLVEFLVVIALIAILAAILWPVLARARHRAYQTKCASNLHQLIRAVHAYANDYDGHAPPYHTNYNKWREENLPEDDPLRGQPLRLRNALLPYMSDSRICYCPSDKYAGRDIVPPVPNPPYVAVNRLYWSYYVNTHMGVDRPVSVSAPCVTAEDYRSWPPGVLAPCGKEFIRPATDPKPKDPGKVVYAEDVGPIHLGGTGNRVWLDGHADTRTNYKAGP